MLILSKMARTDQPMIQPVANLAFTEVLTGGQKEYLLSLYVTVIALSRKRSWLVLLNLLTDASLTEIVSQWVCVHNIEST